MSYILATYVVPYARLIAIRGSRDEKMLADVLADAREYIAEIDKQRFEGYDPGRDHPIFSVAEAIKDIFMGNWRCAADGSVYGEAVETLCCYLGERIGCEDLVVSRSVWFKDMDAWLKSEQVPLEFLDLLYRAPIPLPPTARIEMPSVGHWTPEEIRTAAPAVNRVLLGRTEDDYQDDYVEALQEVQGWFDTALATPGACIIGIYG